METDVEWCRERGTYPCYLLGALHLFCERVLVRCDSVVFLSGGDPTTTIPRQRMTFEKGIIVYNAHPAFNELYDLQEAVSLRSSRCRGKEEGAQPDSRHGPVSQRHHQ